MAKELLINGEVITVNANDEIVEAVAIENGKITAVGTTKEILQLQDEETRVTDLAERTLMPGIIESHIHTTMYGANVLAVSCKDPEIRTLAALLQKLKQHASTIPAGQWVRAWGFNETSIEEGRFPTREELDLVTDQHPVMVIRACGHLSAVNSEGLAIGGITRNTQNPEGGEIGRRADGEPDGRLIETAHMELYQLAAHTRDEMREAHRVASAHFAEKGITSIHDATGYGLQNIEALREDAMSGVIAQRVYAMVGALNKPEEVVRHYMQLDICTGEGDEHFKYGPVKMFLDGSSSGPTVWTTAPYTSDSGNYGIHYLAQEELDALFIPAHEKGWQVTAHAQGDAAIDQLLNTIEKALQLHPREDARHRIEHAGLVREDQLQRMKALGVIPTPNPTFFSEYGDGYVTNYGDRAQRMYPLASYYRNGIPATITADCPVADFNPMRGIHSAMTRKAPSGQVIGEDEQIRLLQAIRGYTLHAANASFSEKETGSIEVGKFADLVILDRSILSAEVDEILGIKTDRTIIGGETVYLRSKEPVNV
ncbi:amidohydrolase [Sporosarcina saromensis]|uniref:Amidohydrolase n=1 Tax=Sporosarcina saromensis TaxID=359365 RepID=A0ABU4G9U3_9BACL|nr:amidohydrolase [Sporosarcina saromensis]MDW0113110.1 amidohydrolase [Sporosarcina saromensis]